MRVASRATVPDVRGARAASPGALMNMLRTAVQQRSTPAMWAAQRAPLWSATCPLTLLGHSSWDPRPWSCIAVGAGALRGTFFIPFQFLSPSPCPSRAGGRGGEGVK